ncbi:hypothetical protein PCASD_22654, partial [Puccinia coronata f. sp. avenae]
VKELTAEDFLVSSDLSEASTEEDNSSSKPKHVTDQPTVAAAVHNLIKPEFWTPIATGPRQPVPPEFRVPPELRNLKPLPKKKTPRCQSARIRFTQPKNSPSQLSSGE